MKTIICIFLLSTSLLWGKNLCAQKLNNNLKPGDWFECEMEFENGVPVFRNHWLGNNNSRISQQLISIRFSLESRSSKGVETWNYKILRYKNLSNFYSSTQSKTPNMLCNDSWYPDIFVENFDSIRNSLTGVLSISKSEIIKHDSHHNSKHFGVKSVLPVKTKKRFYSINYTTGRNLFTMVEKVAELFFHSHSLLGDSINQMKWQRLERIKKISNNEVRLSIRKNRTDYVNSCTAYFLPNGLPYAFSDSNQHKVLTITNASFPIPNQAVLNITDQRQKKEQDGIYFTNLMWVTPLNKSHVIYESGIPEFIQLNSAKVKKVFKLKCGVGFSLRTGIRQYTRLFLEPGDTVNVILRDDEKTTFKINNNVNSKWWQRHDKLDNHMVAKAQISPEFKSYLYLLNETYKRIHTIEQAGIDSFSTSILDFYYLKSYHYNSLQHFTRNYNRRKENLINESGAPHRSGFQYIHHNALSHHTDFPLYYELHRILIEQYKFLQTGKSNEKFTHFINQCGDTLLRNDIRNKLIGRKSIQPGQKLPFTSLLSQDDQEVVLLPSNGKYGLLFLYSIRNKVNEFKKLTDSIPESIHSISYCMNKGSRKYPNKNPQVHSIGDLKRIELNGHPIMNNKLADILVAPPQTIVLLYDEDGEILYSGSFERPYGEEKYQKYVEQYRAKLINAIEQSKSESKGDLSRMLPGIILSILITLILTILISRYRIRRIKKRNEQEQLIQELKLKSVQSQLNPHFLFNALNSIQHLVNSDNTRQANKYLIGFSGLLRGVLGNAEKRLVPLTDELQLIDRYCELEQLRMDFEYQLDVKTNTPPDLIEVPYMLLQPIVENSIKHGIAKKEEKGQLRLEVSEAHSFLLIKALDNGPGFGNIPMEQLFEKGKGMKLTMEKLQSIYGEDAGLSIQNNGMQGGTVQIKLKIG